MSSNANSNTHSVSLGSVSSLRCCMKSILTSIQCYSQVHSQWSNRAPGLSRDPILSINAHLDSTTELNELSNKVAHKSVATPPVIGTAWDEHVDFVSLHSDPLPGLGNLKSSVMAELAFLDKFESDVQDPNAVPPSSNAAFLASIWEEALYAAFSMAPLQEISSSFPLPSTFPSKGKKSVKTPNGFSKASQGNSKPNFNHSTKIDVVAEGGRTWIRLSSMRASNLLSEFREAESYFEDDSEEDGEEDGGLTMEERVMKKLGAGELDEAATECSLLQTGLELQAAANLHSIPEDGTKDPSKPRLQLVLVRLLPTGSHSSSSVASIPQDFNLAPNALAPEFPEAKRYNLRLRGILSALEKMGIEIVLGSRMDSAFQGRLPSELAYANQDFRSSNLPSQSIEHPLPVLPSPPPLPIPFKEICPTRKINLDLSALIALVSDITHAEFPPGSQEARRNGGDESHETLKNLYVSNFNEGNDLRAWAKKEENQTQDSGEFQLKNNNAGPHGRALKQQLIRELDGDQFIAQLAGVASSTSSGEHISKVELHVTREAQQKFWEIIQVVPGDHERRRARALFQLDENCEGKEDEIISNGNGSGNLDVEEAKRMFWLGSRWDRDGDPLSKKIKDSIGIPIKLLPESNAAASRSPLTPDLPLSSPAILSLPLYRHLPTLSFSRRMHETLSSALLHLDDASPAQIPSSGTPPFSASSIRRNQSSNNSPPGGGNSKQTRHTLNSFLAAAEHGMTTLTTNLSSIKWLVKEMGRRQRFSLATHLDELEDSQSYDETSSPSFALLWVTHPRSLAERMRVAAILESHGKKPSSLPSFPESKRSESMIKNEQDIQSPKTPTFGDVLPLLNLNGGGSSGGSSSSPYRNADFSSSARSLSATGVSRSNGAQGLSGSRSSKLKLFRKRASTWASGPRPPRRHVIRHYRWWPLARVENAWLRITRPVAWREPDATWSEEADWNEQEAEETEARGDDSALPPPSQSPRLGSRSRKARNGNSWGRHVRADLRTNWLHWLLLAITYVAWAFGFSFLVKSIWYEASITASDGTETTPSFFGCTSTYWLLNSRCGLDGQECSPFTSNESIPFRCPSGCLGTTLGGPRAVGKYLPAYVPLVVGGGDGVYRGDSFICSAAVHAGLIKNNEGGCGSLNLIGTYSDYLSADSNGLYSVPFNSTFPVSFSFEPLQDATGHKCKDTRSKGYILDVLLSAFVGFVLRPKRIVWFFTLACVGFWHINFISEPRAYPPVGGDPFADFLPFLFGIYVIWKVAVRFVFPAFGNFPIEREVYTLGLWWIGVLLNVVFASVPLNRLVASDIRSQPGSLTALLIIIIIVLVIAVNQVRVIRSTGHLPKYLTLAIIGGLIIALLAAVPETGLRLHHYIIALALVCFCGFSTRLSLIYCAFLLGMYTNGVARWGFDGIIQSTSSIIGDGITDSSIPSFLPASTFNSSGIISWNSIPSNISSDWDSFQLLIDDVLRYSGTQTSLNVTETLFDSYVNTNNSFYPGDVNSTIFNQPHYLRIAYVNSQTATLGDFTKAGTAFLVNGTFIEPLPGAT